MNVLVLDIGTTSMRGILYDARGRALGMHSVQTPLVIDKATGYIEQTPDTYTGAAVTITRALAERHVIDAISVTAFRSAPTLVDRDGEALGNFIMWQDTRNREICKRLEAEGLKIYEKSGARLNTVFTASKLTWFREQAPDLWKRTFKAMIVPDYVIHFMTGAFATDRTYGSRTHLMDIRTLEWDDELCGLFNIDRDKLCPLVDQGTVIGRVGEAFSSLTGVRTGLPVVSAGGDQQCGALGLGVMDATTLEVNSGTGSFVISVCDAPSLDNAAVICNVAAIPGKYTLEMNIISSASAVNWLIRELFPEYWGDPPDFAAVNRIAGATPVGANGLYAVPHFQGAGSRDWNPDARAIFSGFSLSTRREDLIRALYEGIACEIAKSIDSLPASCRGAQSIAVAGGLSNSDVYNRILCDMTNRPLKRGANPQATALGAYISASVALGIHESYAGAYGVLHDASCDSVYTPDPENARFYEAYKARTERLYRAGLVDE